MVARDTGDVKLEVFIVEKGIESDIVDSRVMVANERSAVA